MTTTAISFVLGTTNKLSPLGFEAWINDHKFFDTDHVDCEQKISVEIADDEANHELRFILKNKLPGHTCIDDAGNIVSDACVTVDQLNFDEIELKQLFINQAVYTHNFNGTGESVEDKFFGTMGCNGTVSLTFYTPMYLWMLEHM